MKKKFLQFLSNKIEDLGLSDKAVADLIKIGCAGLADDASDDDIIKAVDSVVPYAKAMQGEYTRKVQAAKQSQKQSHDGEGGADGAGDDDKDIPAWFKAYKQQNDEAIAALKAENAELKAADARKAREAQIAAKAKELGIPDFLMKRFSIAEDADFVKELTEYKQDLVTANLMPAESAGEQGNVEQHMKDAAKAWAQTLPDAK